MSGSGRRPPLPPPPAHVPRPVPAKSPRPLRGYIRGWRPGPRALSDAGAEIALIEKTMKDDPRAYYRDEAMQERYRALLRRGTPGAQEAAGR